MSKDKLVLHIHGPLPQPKVPQITQGSSSIRQVVGMLRPFSQPALDLRSGLTHRDPASACLLQRKVRCPRRRGRRRPRTGPAEALAGTGHPCSPSEVRSPSPRFTSRWGGTKANIGNNAHGKIVHNSKRLEATTVFTGNRMARL